MWRSCFKLDQSSDITCDAPLETCLCIHRDIFNGTQTIGDKSEYFVHCRRKNNMKSQSSDGWTESVYLTQQISDTLTSNQSIKVTCDQREGKRDLDCETLTELLSRWFSKLWIQQGRNNTMRFQLNTTKRILCHVIFNAKTMTFYGRLSTVADLVGDPPPPNGPNFFLHFSIFFMHYFSIIP